MNEPGQSGGVKIDILKSLRFDFFAGIVELEDADGAIHSYKIVRDSLVSSEPSPEQGLPSPVQSLAQAVGSTPSERSVADSSGQKTVRLVGRIKGTPRPGRPDGKGRPTAWVKLAVHEEGRESARMYSTTFHVGTTNKSLTLEDGSRIVVEGYVRESDDPKRMDAFSVFRILSSSDSEE
jgi:hypothetical protein